MKTPATVAFSGRLGSGKSTLARELAVSLDWPLASFGGYLREIAAARSLPDTRVTLQELGAALLENEGPQIFTERVLHAVGWNPDQPVVVEGVRHVAVATALREMVAPRSLLLVYLQTPEEIRLQRLKQRGGEELKRLSAFESHSTEADVGENLRSAADLLLDSGQEIPILIRAVTDALSR